jgi:hypothetical protein
MDLDKQSDKGLFLWEVSKLGGRFGLNFLIPLKMKGLLPSQKLLAL